MIETDAIETVVEHTITALRDGIRDGRYAPGQRLVVADITKALGVSAGTVREAIRRLTGDGLVEITPNRGAAIRTLTGKDVREIFLLREVVEGLAARLAAERVGMADNRRLLEACLAEMRQIVPDLERDYHAHNHTFHQVIYEMAGTGRIQETAVQLSLPLYQLRLHHLIGSGYRRVSAGEHELIAEAIFEGDGVRAERAMRNHVRNSALAMLDAMETARMAAKA